MSPNLRRYGAMAVAVGLLVASAGSVHAQGFGVIPNQPFVNNPNFLTNPGLAQAQFLYNLQARQMINSNPYIASGAPAAAVNPLVDPYTGGNIYSPGSALSPFLLFLSFGLDDVGGCFAREAFVLQSLRQRIQLSIELIELAAQLATFFFQVDKTFQRDHNFTAVGEDGVGSAGAHGHRAQLEGGP